MGNKYIMAPKDSGTASKLFECADESIVIMGGEPIPNVSIEEVNMMFAQAETEQKLANIYAMASNKAWWSEDDVYNYDENTPKYDEACRITDEWFATEKLVREKIFEILKSEGVSIPSQGYTEVLKSFMERNGYRDGRGWWIKNID